MMQITCPNCGETVPAENINIQQMGAVCPYCDSVFRFELPGDKIKRRKVKPPEKINVTETDDRLELAFRTNFRLDKDQTFQSAILVSGLYIVVTLIMFANFLLGTLPIFAPLIAATIALLGLYWLGLRVYNATEIHMTDEDIFVTRTPLRSPFNRNQRILLDGIERIITEETAVSKREGYDTPRYVVYGETVDKSKRIITNDLVEEYAQFVTQKLNEQLEARTYAKSAIYDEDAINLNEGIFIAEDEPHQRNTGVR